MTSLALAGLMYWNAGFREEHGVSAPTEPEEGRLFLELAAGVSSVTYSVQASGPDGVSRVQLDGIGDDILAAAFTYQYDSMSFVFSDDAVMRALRVNWSDANGSYAWDVLIVTRDSATFALALGELDEAAFSAIGAATAEEWQEFLASADSVTDIPSGTPFAPGQAISADVAYLAELTEDDRIYGDADTSNTKALGQGDDKYLGGPVGNLVWGNAGDDTISGLTGDDTLYGGLGDDWLEGRGGVDRIYGGAGNDDIGNQAYDFDHVAAAPSYLFGGAGDDFVHGVQLGDTISGGADNDRLFGGGSGGQFIFGGTGNDSIVMAGEDFRGAMGQQAYGGDGNDTIESRGDVDSSYFGGRGDDSINIYRASGAQVFGGAGNDHVDARNAESAWVRLGSGDDLFDGTGDSTRPADDSVWGMGGDDSLYGGLGFDDLRGQFGVDVIDGGAGADAIYGGDQADTLDGGDGNDTVYGGLGRDVADLGTGFDIWYDHAQSDVYGADIVDGGGGWDTIQSLGGDDTLIGGAGSDTFVFGAGIGHVVIEDYAVGTDALELATALWAGAFDQAGLDAISDASGGALVLNFDADSSLTLTGVASNAGLLDDIGLV